MAEATLFLKGATLRARDRARDFKHAVNLCEEELSRQVKRHREKRRGRRKVGTETIRTPGYPLCRFAILLAEVKAAMEVTAGFAYQGHNDTFIVPAGFRFEYDTARPMFNAAGDPLDKTNGRVTRIWQLKTASLASGQWDGDANYDLIFDANSVGWMVSPLTGVPAAASLYIASFATFAGVHLRDPGTGAPVPNNDPTQTIVTRSDTTEIKEWEALGAYVHAQAAANGGTLPDRYNKAGTTELPRRAICTGANAVNKNCSH